MKNRTRKRFLLKILGKKIKEIREKSNIPIEYIALKLDISQKRFQKVEKGYYNLSMLEIFIIAEVLNVKVSELFEDINFMI